jgi:hypothetical protein
MREKLKERELKRGTYTATFVRFGSKSGYKGYPVKTVLFRDVADSAGVVVTDHLWFTCGKQFTALDLLPGDVVSFAARSKAYTKGYRGHRDDDDLPAVETDYRLSNPTNVMKWGTKPLNQTEKHDDGQQIRLF